MANIKRLYVSLLIILISCVVTSRKALAQSSRVKKNFDFGWKFHLGNVPGAYNPFYDDQTWKDVNVPHDWSIEGKFSPKYASSTAYLPAGIGWYRKTFVLPEADKGKHITIQFNGVYDKSTVWINGHYLGYRPYGFITFHYNMTPYLHFGAKKNVIAVRVNHSDFADSRWYTGSGIYRHVWLTVTDPVHVVRWGTYVTTPVVKKGSAEVQVVTKIANDSKNIQEVNLESEIVDSNGSGLNQTISTITIPAGQTAKLKQELKLANPSLWSPDHPYMYRMVSMIMQNGKVIDRYTTPFGVRTIRFDANKGFILNGHSVKLKGICMHDAAGALGAAVPNAEWAYRLKLLKEAGVNAIRTSHNPKSPAFMNLCDKMGFLVMDEAFDEWELGKQKWIKGRNVGQNLGAAGLGRYFSLHGYSDFFKKWAKKDLQSMVRRDRNHPSVILWSIGNEIDYPNQPYTDPGSKNYRPWRPRAYEITEIARRLYSDVKDVDTTRPVTAALANIPLSNKIGYASLLDVVGYNYQEKYYQHDHKEFPYRKIFGSETSHSYAAWLAVKDNPFVAGQFLWTGYDYLGEAGRFPNRSNGAGLIDLSDFKKPAFYFRKSLWTKKPMVYLAAIQPDTSHHNRFRFHIAESWNWTKYKGKPVSVVAYTNCDNVELFLNGKSLGSKKIADSPYHVLRWVVPYEAGTLRAVARDHGRVVARYELKTAGKPYKIVLERNRETIKADGEDMTSVKVLVTDRNGIVVPNAENEVSFNVTGPGKNIGIGNGNNNSLESFKTNHHHAYEGKERIYIRSERGKKGVIQIEARSAGLQSASTRITAE